MARHTPLEWFIAKYEDHITLFWHGGRQKENNTVLFDELMSRCVGGYIDTIVMSRCYVRVKSRCRAIIEAALFGNGLLALMFNMITASHIATVGRRGCINTNAYERMAIIVALLA